mgnify:CR=1 FL=1
MNIRIESRLEKAVMALSYGALSPQERYDLCEQAAIAMLDSDFDEYPEGELEAYLLAYLKRKRGEFGLKLD